MNRARRRGPVAVAFPGLWLLSIVMGECRHKESFTSNSTKLRHPPAFSGRHAITVKPFRRFGGSAGLAELPTRCQSRCRWWCAHNVSQLRSSRRPRVCPVYRVQVFDTVFDGRATRSVPFTVPICSTLAAVLNVDGVFHRHLHTPSFCG